MQQSPKNVEGIGLADSGSKLPCLACLLIRLTASFCEDDDEDGAAQPYCRISKRSKGKADSVLSFWDEVSPKGEGRCLPQSQFAKSDHNRESGPGQPWPSSERAPADRGVLDQWAMIGPMKTK